MSLDQTTRHLLRKVNRTIYRFRLIEPGDSILIGFSGGKDSIALARCLALRKQHIPHTYTIHAVQVYPDFIERDLEYEAWTETLLQQLDIPLHKRYIHIDEKNPKQTISCFWCSWNRRKTIFETADELGCNKVALGHNLDDFGQTMLINFLYHGKVDGMDPIISFFDGQIIVIRPLIYVPEHEITRYVQKMGYSIPETTCPYAKTSKRKTMQDFLKGFSNKDKNQMLQNLFRLGTASIPKQEE